MNHRNRNNEAGTRYDKKIDSLLHYWEKIIDDGPELIIYVLSNTSRGYSCFVGLFIANFVPIHPNVKVIKC